MYDGFVQEELNSDHQINFSYCFKLDSNCAPRAEMPVVCPVSRSAHLFAGFGHFTVGSLRWFDHRCIGGLHLFSVFPKI